MATTKYLQANMNHCAGAQDLLFQCIAQWGIKVAVVSEPYVVPVRSNWFGDLDDSVAIFAPTSAGFEVTRRGRGYVMGVVHGVAVIEAILVGVLVGVGAVIAQVPSRAVLVTGDWCGLSDW